MLSTVIFRYLGTAVQFVVLAAIARSTSPNDYGLYMLCLSMTFSFYYFIGLGSSESGLARVARGLAGGGDSEVPKVAGSVLAFAGAGSLVLLLFALVVGLTNFWQGDQKTTIVFVAVFIAANGLMFNIAQLLLGMGKLTAGSFFFYPAINLALLFSTVPVAIWFNDVSFSTIALASGTGATVAALSALAICLRLVGLSQLRPSLSGIASLIREGFGLTAIRILHVSSFWIPTMVTGFLLAPAVAGVMGTAGRLAIAVAAVIAAIRFVIRPAINAALERNELDSLFVLIRSVAFMTTGAAIVAFILNEFFGEYVIGLFFGADMKPAAALLSILLIGVGAEAVFGPVDELLKAAGQQKIVTWIYGISVPVFLVGCLAASQFGLEWIAWLQVFYVFSIFLLMNLAVRKHFGFFVIPGWPKLEKRSSESDNRSL